MWIACPRRHQRRGLQGNWPWAGGTAWGWEIHENLRLSQQNKERLPAGAVFSIEPGIYLPDWGGVRIEDLVLLDDNGLTLLSQCPKRRLFL
ncbi:MAG: M24 family metallopeptidase [Ardenticatenales bacterium]|nr:M24 family metallopeptidase [Ardenticatenales bacterium]